MLNCRAIQPKPALELETTRPERLAASVGASQAYSACISTRQDNSNKRARKRDKERRSWRRTLVDDGHGKRRGRVLLLPVSSILRVTTSLAHGEVPGHHFKQACGEQQAARALALHKFLARCLRRARLTILEFGSADA